MWSGDGRLPTWIEFPGMSGLFLLVTPSLNPPQVFFTSDGISIGIRFEAPLPDSNMIALAFEEADKYFPLEWDDPRV
jgi:hypothetical protein